MFTTIANCPNCGALCPMILNTFTWDGEAWVCQSCWARVQPTVEESPLTKLVADWWPAIAQALVNNFLPEQRGTFEKLDSVMKDPNMPLPLRQFAAGGELVLGGAAAARAMDRRRPRRPRRRAQVR